LSRVGDSVSYTNWMHGVDSSILCISKNKNQMSMFISC
jgi:hypothetical protein